MVQMMPCHIKIALGQQMLPYLWVNKAGNWSIFRMKEKTMQAFETGKIGVLTQINRISFMHAVMESIGRKMVNGEA